MRKKFFVLISAVMALMLVLTSCGSGNPSKSSNKSSEPVTLSFYINNQADTGWIDFMKKDIIGKFQEAHPNIKINMSLTADPTGLAKQQLAAGGGPDIVALDGPSTLQLFASANYLLPLDKYAQQYGWEQRFNEFAYDTEKRDGKLMGVPAAHETTVVYYNKKMFEDNGWRVPQNFNDLVQLSEKIKAKSIIPFAFGSSDFKQANEWWLSLAYNETLGADQFKKVLTGELAWNSPQMVEATQKMVDMWQKGYIYKDSAAITIDDASNLFLTGKAAMKMEGTWLISNLLTKKPSFDWGMFMMPSWKDGVEANFPLAIGGAFGINVNTKHPDEAAAFLDWMNSKELAVKDLQFGNFDSVNGVDINSAQNLDQHVKDAYKLLDDAIAGNKTGYAAWTYWPPKTETYAWSNIESVYMNQMTVKDYLDNLQKNFEQDKKDDNLFKFGDK